MKHIICWSVDENIVIRSSQEPNPVFLLEVWFSIHGNFIEHNYHKWWDLIVSISWGTPPPHFSSGPLYLLRNLRGRTSYKVCGLSADKKMRDLLFKN